MKRVVVISGGNDGLGRAVAERLVADNTVVILGPPDENVAKAAEELSVDHHVADVADWKQLNSVVEQVVEKHKRIDCLLNNAGVWIQGPIDENDPDRIKRLIDTNATGVILLNRAVVPVMKKQKGGVIVHTVSQGGLYAKAERSVYTASKWALTGLSRSLQHELAPFGIKVMGIYPSKMNTRLFEKAGVTKDMEDALDPKAVAEVVEFMMAAKGPVTFPEVGVAHLDNL